MTKHYLTSLAKQKKYGFFAGVFTPSLLTILGVIMYMRLGWVVGNSGLWGSLLVILLAHVISVATGLSISSISTDKKVGVGGVYYILSRSLGLPMGGAIGLTLFIATSFSIALYLIGFAENFNPVLNLGVTVNDFRVSGTLALLVLTLLGYISTSIALKSQYFILGAIGLSILSILFGTGDVSPDTVPILAEGTPVSFETIFAIFFPAVTGFTAGIAMSGDLRDPKKDIPVGTLLSIGVGFIVYVGLAIFLNFRVSPEILMSDNNILMKISVFAPFVVAGIWGATLSSAIGGILGGPRILQAMSMDSIVPFSETFAKGAGRNNEPRNALILTIVIAEIGILIGELDVIARIVSMFYLAAYNFINLSFFLEKTVSNDFSPRFKVSKWFGLLGFIATFLVMFKLDLVAMLGAYVILAGVYFYLKRKELTLNTGDIWGGVWSSVVRVGLKRMEAKEEHQRNWRPNILLFSGGTDARPYLLELSKELTGRAGMVSNFDLIENPEAKVLFPKREQAVKDASLREEGIFARRQEVKDIYMGIETIASTYGFSGIEPNTVLMGWPKNSENPVRFAQLTQTLIDLDYNVLYVDYDRSRGFGKYANIDVWWRGISNNVTLMMKLVKLLSSSNQWHNAHVRVLLVNDEAADRTKLEKNIGLILEDFRVRASVKIINNSIDKLPFFELMEHYSGYADLVLMGIPEKIRNVETYVQQTNNLVKNIGTTLMIRASSQFEVTNLGLDEKPKLIGQLDAIKEVALSPMELTFNAELNQKIVQLESALQHSNKRYVTKLITPLADNYLSLIEKYKGVLDIFFERLNRAKASNRSFAAVYREALLELQEVIIESNKRYIENKARVFESLIEDETEIWYRTRQHYFIKSNDYVKRILQPVDIQLLPTDSKRVRRIKKWKLRSMRIFKKASILIEWKDLLKYMGNTRNLKNQKQLLFDLGMVEAHFAKTLRDRVLYQLEVLFDGVMTDNKDREGRVKAIRGEVFGSIDGLLELIKNLPENLLAKTHQSDRELMQEIVRTVEKIDVNYRIEELEDNLPARQVRKVKREINSFPGFWFRNQHFFANVMETTLVMTALHIDLRYLRQRVERKVDASLFGMFKRTNKQLRTLFDDNAYSDEAFEKIKLSTERIFMRQNPNELLLSITEQLRSDINHLPKTVELIDEDTLLNFSDFQEDEVRQLTVELQNLVDYFIELDFIEPLNRGISRAYNLITAKFEDLAAHIAYITDLEGVENTDNTAENDELTDMRVRLVSKIDTVQGEIEELERTFYAMLNKQFDDVTAKLRTSELLNTMKNPERYIHFQRKYHGYRERFEKVVEKVKSISERIWADFGRRKYNLKVAEFADKSKVLVNKRKVFRDFTIEASIKSTVDEQLPTYYKHLFTGKQVFSKRAFIPRDKEIAQISESLYRLEKGESGGIMIVGEPQIGKSHIIEQTIELLEGRKIVRVTPPMGGIDPQLSLLSAFQAATELEGNFFSIMSSLPEGTVFVLNDVELWWLRHSSGSKQIERLIWLIERYGKRHVFLMNMSIHSFDLIRQITKLESILLSTIVLPPVDTRELAELIWERNKFAELRIDLDNGQVEEIGKKEVLRLMRRCAEIAGGNPGSALHLWLASITTVNKDRIAVKFAEPPACPLALPHSWAMVLLHVVLHQNLSAKNLRKIFEFQDDDHIKGIVSDLLHAELITHVSPNVYTINPYAKQAIITQLKSQLYLKKF